MGLFLYAIPYIKPITGGSAMSLTELFIIAVGLSMDAFAVAVCKGLAMPRMSWKGAADRGSVLWRIPGRHAIVGILPGL